MDDIEKKKLFIAMTNSILSSRLILNNSERLVYGWATQDMAREIVKSLDIEQEFLEFYFDNSNK